MRSLVLIVALAACGKSAPSDDPNAWTVDTSVAWKPQIGPVRWVVPSDGMPVNNQASNNNLDIEFFEDKLFMAWRTAPFHFASDATVMHIVASTDGGVHWVAEAKIALGSDVREPRFLALAGKLQLSFFQAGTNPIEFDPKALWHVNREKNGTWSAPVQDSAGKEIVWNMKVRNGVAWRSSYSGNHYQAGTSLISVFFKRSSDGLAFSDVGMDPVYFGGVSESAFEIAADGSLWVDLRNEDGDDSGFGTLLCHAQAASLGTWECPATSDPNRHDSAQMLRHGNDLYMVARRDVGGPYDEGLNDLSFDDRKSKYLSDYSFRPKRTALYKIDQATLQVVWLQDLPSAGDTAYPAIRRTGTHTFLIANYTSPLDTPDISWFDGQTSPRGTQIYFVELTFTK